MGEIKTQDVKETKTPEAEGYKNIKPDGNMTIEKVTAFFDRLFGETSEEKADASGDPSRSEANEEKLEKFEEIEKLWKDYLEDLKEKSEFPETILNDFFDTSDLKKLTPEETAKRREEFNEKKEQLKREWEEKNGRPWPKYEHDVYSASGKLIRKAGTDYDAHHIQPLGLGGKNEVDNITPLNAEVHYDKQGVHSPESPYSKLDQLLGGI